MDLGLNFAELIKRACSESFTSEREFREKIVIKLLEYLGWKDNNEVKIEFPIPIGQSTLRVDYLVGDHRGKFALEVKTPDTSIEVGTNPRTQIVSYLNLLKNVRYGVLYNGVKMLIFKKGIDDPIITWGCGDQIAILTYLSTTSFPEILDAAFPDQSVSTNEVEKSKRNVDPLTIKQQRFKELKLEGTLAVISFILGIILTPISVDYRSTLTTALVVGAIASFLLFSILYVADYVRLRIIYRNRWK